MVAVATILFAFPLGFFVRNHLTAAVAYTAIFGQVFTFQTPYVLRPEPNDRPEWSYLIVTGLIFLAGFGLVALGQWVQRRRAVRGTYQTTDGESSRV